MSCKDIHVGQEVTINLKIKIDKIELTDDLIELVSSLVYVTIPYDMVGSETKYFHVENVPFKMDYTKDE